MWDRLDQYHSPSTVGVVNGFLGDLADLELLHLDGTGSRADGDNGRESALGDNGNTGTLGVLLGELSELLSDLGDILGAPLVALGVGNSLSLVTEGVVGVGQDAIQLVLEELGNERSRDGEHEGLMRIEGLAKRSNALGCT